MDQGIKVLVLVGGLLLSLTSAADARELPVSSKDFGNYWPFIVDSVDLMCDGPSPKALARTSDGTVYALNGSARSVAKSRGWADGRDITKPSPTMPAVKMDYSNIVQVAQELCTRP